MLRYVGDALSSRHEPEGVRTLSNLYWRALLLVAFLVVVLILTYGMWGLLRVLGDLSAAVKAPAPAAPILDRRLLDATVEGIQVRRGQFEVLGAGSDKAILDPSR